MKTRPRVALAAALLAACNFESSFQLTTQVDPGRPGDEFRDACHHAAIADCAYSERCDPYTFERRWPDRATCEDRSTLACQLRATDPHANFDEAFIVDCALTADFPCSSDGGYDEAVDAYLARCETPRGDLPLGSSCSSAAACATGFCFVNGLNAPTLCGVCLPRPCEEGCDAGTICWLGVDGSSECKPIHPEGAACAESSQCETLLCTAGICAPRAEVGEACDVSASLSVCEAGTYCEPATERCTRPPLAEAGEPCGALPGAYTLCSGGANCLASSSSTCVAPVPDGFLCDPSQGRDCLWPAGCVAGYCRFHPLSC